MNGHRCRTWRALGIGALLPGLVVAAAGCGGSNASAGTAATSGPSAGHEGKLPPANANDGAGGTKGGVLHVVSASDISSLDPGQSTNPMDWSAIYATQRPLYSFKPSDPLHLVPDLAKGMPEVSADHKTVTVHIRDDVRFSPPVNRPVTSADVKYAIERGANPHVASGEFHSYFSSIVGADKADGGPIPGIETPDATTLVFHLTKPVSGFFTQTLMLPLTAPVPKDFAAKYDAMKPTRYGNYQVATGPYMVKSDASGKVTGVGYRPGESLTLVRNPNWSATTDYRPAYVDEVDWSIGGDPVVLGRQVLTGNDMILNETAGAATIQLAFQRYPEQIFTIPGTLVAFIPLNTAHGPFANADLRRAVYAALDREAIIRAAGGTAANELATHFLYPNSIGFEQAGGYDTLGYDFQQHPNGDMAVAERYMKKAGYPSGKYTGDDTVTIVGLSTAKSNAQIVDATLRKLGFHTRVRLLDVSAMITFCGTPKDEVDVCANWGWSHNVPDPQDVAREFDGRLISHSGGNQNIPQLNDPAINAAIDRASALNGVDARAAAWGAIDKQIVGTAAAIPTVWTKAPIVESSDVDGVSAVWNTGLWDLSFTSLK
jgi:peptide/nickel transport system substrate-binding protein